MMVVAPLSARLVERIGTKRVVTIGLLDHGHRPLLALSFIKATTPYPLVILLFCVMAAGMGLTMAPATECVMGSLPRDKAGVGSPNTLVSNTSRISSIPELTAADPLPDAGIVDHDGGVARQLRQRGNGCRVGDVEGDRNDPRIVTGRRSARGGVDLRRSPVEQLGDERPAQPALSSGDDRYCAVDGDHVDSSISVLWT